MNLLEALSYLFKYPAKCATCGLYNSKVWLAHRNESICITRDDGISYQPWSPNVLESDSKLVWAIYPIPKKEKKKRTLAPVVYTDSGTGRRCITDKLYSAEEAARLDPPCLWLGNTSYALELETDDE